MHTDIHIHKYTHTHIYIYIHTHTHAHTQGDSAAVVGHLKADLNYQYKLVRFLENHDGMLVLMCVCVSVYMCVNVRKYMYKICAFIES
jgi:hypothetical protein